MCGRGDAWTGKGERERQGTRGEGQRGGENWRRALRGREMTGRGDAGSQDDERKRDA